VNAPKVIALLLLVLGAAVATGWPVLFSLAYLLVGVLVLSWLWSRLALARLDVHRLVRGDRVQVGDDVVEQLLVRNRSLLPKLWVALRDYSTLPGRERGRVIALPPHREGIWTIRTPAWRRGEYFIGPTELRASDPFGMFTVRRRLPEERRVLVLPATEPLPGFELPSRDLPGGARTRSAGSQSSAQVAGVRDYAPGDPVNRIHWPSTVRASRLIVKELEHEPAADVWIALDLHADAQVGTGHESTEEYGVTVAASLARHFLESGRTVALAMQGDQHLMIQPDRGERQLVRLLEALAVARGVGAAPFADLLRSDALRPDRSASLIAITPSVDPAWPEALRLATVRGARAVAVVIEPSTFGGNESALHPVSQLAATHVPTYLVKRGEPLADALRSDR
jgi:uncharacterized protein (DUF58 family)